MFRGMTRVIDVMILQTATSSMEHRNTFRVDLSRNKLSLTPTGFLQEAESLIDVAAETDLIVKLR